MAIVYNRIGGTYFDGLLYPASMYTLYNACDKFTVRSFFFVLGTHSSLCNMKFAANCNTK